MKALVTGHLGFIGSHVYEHLLSHGHEVDGYDIPYDLGAVSYTHLTLPTNREV